MSNVQTIFTFYVEGLKREQEVVAETLNAARKLLWDGLTDDEKNAVRQIEWIEARPAST